jgi:hemolysin III
MLLSLRLREPVSGLSHLAGALLGALGLVYLIQLGIDHGGPRHVVGFALFGGTMVATYLTSALYHLPFCLLPLHGWVGWSLLVVIWAMALAGVIMKLFWLEAPRWAVVGPYLVMGWMALLCIVPLVEALSPAGMAWLLAEGLAYSLGAVVYATKRPDPLPKVFGFHEIWHLFVIAGSFFHFQAVARYLVWMS